jgi:hypothetical protein
MTIYDLDSFPIEGHKFNRLIRERGQPITDDTGRVRWMAITPGVMDSIAKDCNLPVERSIELPQPKIGTAVEKMLSGVGITKERVAEWTGLKDCGCEKRKEWLDAWGNRQHEKLTRILNKAARFYFGGSLDAPARVSGERDADAPQAAQGEDAETR